jgi:GNAT superfamily N-acetyltransferase
VIHGLARRPATAADLPFLLDLRARSMGPHHAVAGIVQGAAEAEARVRAHLDVAEIVEVDGRPVGLVKLLREPGAWRLVQLQLLPAWQGRGIGTSLVTATIGEARAAGAALELGVLAVNPARRLYERLGFVVVGHDEHGPHMRHEPWRLRAARPDDAPCIGLLAMQVFLDTYAGAGIRPDIVREVQAECAPEVYAERLADPATRIVLAERAGHLLGFAEWGAGCESPIAGHRHAARTAVRAARASPSGAGRGAAGPGRRRPPCARRTPAVAHGLGRQPQRARLLPRAGPARRRSLRLPLRGPGVREPRLRAHGLV